VSKSILNLCTLWFLSTFAVAQDITLHGMVNIISAEIKAASAVEDKSKHNMNVNAATESGNSGVVVWLTDTRSKKIAVPGSTARLLQKDKRFTPHILAITVGTAIEFPNQDPFFHDVFSIYRGKPFDLGLYESGTIRKVKFSEPGASYIFCNIHPEMSAVVVALPTPYFSTTGRDGSFTIPHLSPGMYKMEVWYEHATEAELASLSRTIDINDRDKTLPTITLQASGAQHDHLNKYGEPYPIDRPAKY
jgi:plastocyanin